MPPALSVIGQSGNQRSSKKVNVVSNRRGGRHMPKLFNIRCMLTSVHPCHKLAQTTSSIKERNVSLRMIIDKVSHAV